MADLIVPLNLMPRPASATPCKASLHHWYLGMPSRGIAGAELTSWASFSSRVSCETRSFALWGIGSLVLQNA